MGGGLFVFLFRYAILLARCHSFCFRELELKASAILHSIHSFLYFKHTASTSQQRSFEEGCSAWPRTWSGVSVCLLTLLVVGSVLDPV
jgi:hypothetical protein